MNNLDPNRLSMNGYDLLIVGCGLFGSVIAHEASAAGLRVLAIDRRKHIGGNCYTERIQGIDVHLYGPHIIHTSDKDIWDYLRQFCNLIPRVVPVMANYKGELFQLPFNMGTFHDMWGCSTPDEAKTILELQKVQCDRPENLEQHALSIVGSDIYEKLIKGYTEKRWGRPCNQLPASVMRRIPIRFTFDNRFFNDTYQGIPLDGYTVIFENMLRHTDVLLETDYATLRKNHDISKLFTVYTGAIDEFFDYCFGPLEYRSLRFEHEILSRNNYQGCPVINYTDIEIPFMRSIEHKHFTNADPEITVVSHEYTQEWEIGIDPYYPLEDKVNKERYSKYSGLAKKQRNVIFGGRLGEYRYYDMQETIKSALAIIPVILERCLR